MTNITPHLGIGDLIIVKMIEITYGVHITTININRKLMRTYSSNFVTKKNFIINLIKYLFPDSVYVINNNPLDFKAFCNKYDIVPIYLYDKICPKIYKKLEMKVDDCIVFHTKLRYDFLIDKFNQYILPDLILFFSSFKTDKRIIITGERKIGINHETTLHKTKSLYNELLLLKHNNIIIDLTKEELTEGGDFNEFLNDIEIINKCACNITFGIGGPYSLTIAFSKNNIAFLPFLDESIYGSIVKKTHNNICETVIDLNEKLNMIYVTSSTRVKGPVEPVALQEVLNFGTNLVNNINII